MAWQWKTAIRTSSTKGEHDFLNVVAKAIFPLHCLLNNHRIAVSYLVDLCTFPHCRNLHCTWNFQPDVTPFYSKISQKYRIGLNEDMLPVTSNNSVAYRFLSLYSIIFYMEKVSTSILSLSLDRYFSIPGINTRHLMLHVSTFKP